MANPKKHHTGSRRDKRRANWKRLELPGFSKCPQCSTLHIPHRICPGCGFYNGQLVVAMEESPAQACRQKPRSSIMVATKLVAQGQADAVVSAGNSGATMTAALWHMRRLPGVLRPAITSLMPTLQGFCVVTDVGANV